jgi:hypothetical protein
MKIRNGISYSSLTADPSDAVNGDMYYNSTTNTFRQYINGSWRDSVGTDIAQTLSNKTLQTEVGAVITDSSTAGANQTLPSGDIGVVVVRLTNASLTSLSGITAGTNGQKLTVINLTGSYITVKDNDSGASAGNKIRTGTGASASLATNSSYSFTYDATSAVWILTGSSSAGTTVANLDSQSANAQGATIANNALALQSASATYPGVVNTTTQTFSGAKTFSGDITLGADLTLTPATDTSTGTNARIATHAAASVNLTSGTLVSIGSINKTSVPDGHVLILTNETGNNVTITNNYSSAAVGEKITTGTGSDITLLNGGSVFLKYDGTLSLWSCVGTGQPTASSGTVTSVTVAAGTGLTGGGTVTTSGTITLNVATTYGALGTYSFLITVSGSGSIASPGLGTTIAASTLNTLNGTSLSGTWRVMGYGTQTADGNGNFYYFNLIMRIA